MNTETVIPTGPRDETVLSTTIPIDYFFQVLPKAPRQRRWRQHRCMTITTKRSALKSYSNTSFRINIEGIGGVELGSSSELVSNKEMTAGALTIAECDEVVIDSRELKTLEANNLLTEEEKAIMLENVPKPWIKITISSCTVDKLVITGLSEHVTISDSGISRLEFNSRLAHLRTDMCIFREMALYDCSAFEAESCSFDDYFISPECLCRQVIMKMCKIGPPNKDSCNPVMLGYHSPLPAVPPDGDGKESKPETVKAPASMKSDETRKRVRSLTPSQRSDDASTLPGLPTFQYTLH